MADHPSTLRVTKAGRERLVDPLDGGRSEAVGERLRHEGRQVLGAQGADGDVPERRLDVSHPDAVAGDGVGAGTVLALLRTQPLVEGLGDRLLRRGVEPGERPFGSRPRSARRGVEDAARLLTADEPLAAARIPLVALVPAPLADGGHVATLPDGHTADIRPGEPLVHAGLRGVLRRADSPAVADLSDSPPSRRTVGGQATPSPPVEAPPEPRELPLSAGASYGKGCRDLMEPEWDWSWSWTGFDFKGCREGWACRSL